MAHLQAIYYRRNDGSEPVRNFIASRPVRQQPTLHNQIDRINVLCTRASPHLPFPHSSQVEGELRELRCHYGSTHYRILYRRSENLVILLHMFLKTTDEIPQSEIAIAKERWADFKARMDAQRRVPPRAAGHDAP